MTFPTRKTLALLAYLAIEPGRHARESLAALLWPDSDDEHARAALRRTILRLREAVGPSCLVATRTEVGLAQPPELDLEPAAIRGELLEGLSLPDAEPFEEWLAARHEEWHVHASSILEQRCLQGQAEGRLEAALQIALRWSAFDRYSEGAYRALMQLHLARGDRSSALTVFQLVQRVFSEELGIQPGAELVELFEYAQDERMDTPAPPTPEEAEPRLVGRTSEHQALVSQFTLARAGKIVCGVVSGQAGIGKSHLVKEFGRWAAAQPALVLTSRAVQTSVPSLQPMAELLRPHLERLADLVGAVWRPELARLLPELGPVSRTRSDPLRLQQAVARALVCLAGRRPLVVIIHDAQWAGADVLDLLRQCLHSWPSEGSGCLMILTIRAEALVVDANLRQHVEALAKEAQAAPITLKPLELEDVRELVRPSATSDRLVRTVFRESGGLPLLIVEALRHIGEHGAWPAHIRRLLTARLGGLTRSGRRIANAAAVLGDGCDSATLCQVAGVDDETGVEAIDELVAARVLDEIGGTYRCHHDALRDAIYAELSPARRVALHRRALAALDALAAPVSMRLHHARAGQRLADAARLALVAGREAMEIPAVGEALNVLTEAHQLSRYLAASDVQEVYERLGRAYELADRQADAARVYEEMMGLALRRRDREMEAAARNCLASITLRVAGDPEQAARHAEAALAAARVAGNRHAETEALLELGEAALYRLDLPRCRDSIRSALEIARHLAAAELVGRCLNVLSYPLLAQGRWSDAAAGATEAAAIYASLRDHSMQADCMAQQAAALIGADRPAEALEIAGRVRALARKLGNRWGEANAAKELALALLDLDRPAEALSVAEEGVIAARAAGYPPLLIFNLAHMGAAYRTLDRPADALAIHREAEALIERHPAPLMERMLGEFVDSELCADFLALDQVDSAASYARRALSRHRAGQYQFCIRYHAVARALVAAGDMARARSAVEVLRQEVQHDARYLRVLNAAQRALDQLQSLR